MPYIRIASTHRTNINKHSPPSRHSSEYSPWQLIFPHLPLMTLTNSDPWKTLSLSTTAADARSTRHVAPVDAVPNQEKNSWKGPPIHFLGKDASSRHGEAIGLQQHIRGCLESLICTDNEGQAFWRHQWVHNHSKTAADKTHVRISFIS